jgi:hypothetical protein
MPARGDARIAQGAGRRADTENDMREDHLTTCMQQQELNFKGLIREQEQT